MSPLLPLLATPFDAQLASLKQEMEMAELAFKLGELAHKQEKELALKQRELVLKQEKDKGELNQKLYVRQFPKGALRVG